MLEEGNMQFVSFARFTANESEDGWNRSSAEVGLVWAGSLLAIAGFSFSLGAFAVLGWWMTGGETSAEDVLGIVV